MTYNVTNGYSPRDYETILAQCVQIVNEQFGTSYTSQSFTGTNLWKFLYATIQGLMTVENNIAELGVKLQDYIRTQNESLIIPRSSYDGIMQIIKDELGLVSSIKVIDTADEAGQIFLAVDVNNASEDYEDRKKSIFKILHENMGAGLFYNGTETGQVTASNGQVFNYAFDLPTETALKVKIQVRVSDNTTLFVETPNEVKNKFLANFAKFYRLGYDFEPQIFLCRDRDLPFASEINISYSTDDGVKYKTDVLEAMYDEKFTINPDDMEVEVI